MLTYVLLLLETNLSVHIGNGMDDDVDETEGGNQDRDILAFRAQEVEQSLEPMLLVAHLHKPISAGFEHGESDAPWLSQASPGHTCLKWLNDSRTRACPFGTRQTAARSSRTRTWVRYLRAAPARIQRALSGQTVIMLCICVPSEMTMMKYANPNSILPTTVLGSPGLKVTGVVLTTPHDGHRTGPNLEILLTDLPGKGRRLEGAGKSG